MNTRDRIAAFGIIVLGWEFPATHTIQEYTIWCDPDGTLHAQIDFVVDGRAANPASASVVAGQPIDRDTVLADLNHSITP